ncbi:MAG: prolipoprotein diacylglyceryl transferase [Gemmatimonadetes bacterium]|nr:prolipoprotein diacylglyceryl transferase [Gemmatimonadota bacterium]
MTVYPLTFQLGFLELTGYGLMMMVGFLMAGWVIQRELRRRGMNEEYASDMVVAAVIGGIVGAKLWYVVLTQDPSALASRSGLVWYGGFIGGTLAVYLNGLRQSVPTRLTMDLVAPSLALGYALGRVGCFMVQDDYGVPTAVPWGMRFPEGLPPTTAHRLNADFGIPLPEGINPLDVLAVHPTQLYETAAMMVAFWALWRLRDHAHGTGWLMGAYLLFAGTERFLVELLRAKDDRILAGFTVAQLTSVLIAIAGVIIMARLGKQDEVAIPANSIVRGPKTT